VLLGVACGVLVIVCSAFCLPLVNVVQTHYSHPPKDESKDSLYHSVLVSSIRKWFYPGKPWVSSGKALRAANASSVLNLRFQDKLRFIFYLFICSQYANKPDQQLWVGETQMTGQHH